MSTSLILLVQCALCSQGRKLVPLGDPRIWLLLNAENHQNGPWQPFKQQSTLIFCGNHDISSKIPLMFLIVV